MDHLKFGYGDLQNTPWEFVEWFYRRHTQYLIEQDQKRNEQFNKFG